MQSEITTVTPEMANGWLRKGTIGRAAQIFRGVRDGDAVIDDATRPMAAQLAAEPQSSEGADPPFDGRIHPFINANRDGSPDSKIMLVTPTLARVWYTRNLNNRKRRKAVVTRYAREMADGRFGISESAICFDTDGVLFEGQHRLLAIIASGVSVWQTVVRDLDPLLRLCAGRGQGRSIADNITMSPNMPDVEKNHVSTWNRMHASVWTSAGRRAQTDSEQMDGTLLHLEAIDWAIQLVGKKHKAPLSQAAVFAPLARAWYTHDRSRLERFVDIMNGAQWAGENERIANECYRWLSQKGGSGRTRDARDTYCKVEAFLLWYLQGRNWSKSGPRVKGRELFPLPGEDTSRRSA